MESTSSAVITIDKGVPIPRRLSYHRRSSPAGTTLRALEIQESFIYPAKNGEPVERTQRRASGMFNHYKPRKFVSRTVIDKGVPRLRVWRVA